VSELSPPQWGSKFRHPAEPGRASYWPESREATWSQHWMLAVMVAFTCSRPIPALGHPVIPLPLAHLGHYLWSLYLLPVAIVVAGILRTVVLGRRRGKTAPETNDQQKDV